jgi:twinkle protein
MNKILDWSTLDLRKQSGKEKVKCPSCNPERKNKQDRSVAVNHNGGYGKCFHCEGLFFRDKQEVNYTLPSQEWKNHTKLSDKLVKWIKDERKINQSTLNHFGITEEKFFQPKHRKEVNNIVFNYFEGDTLVNKKYRSGDKGFTQSKDGKPIFYNINGVIGSEEVWIVEGEFDVLALHEAGISAISVPNGANDNDNFWKNSERYLKDVEKFIIATDNDVKGIELREHIAQRLGRFRCEYIEFENKDANGDLIAGCLSQSVKNKNKFPVSGTFRISELKNDILKLYNNGLPETIYPKNECFGGLKEVYTGMRGHVATITGVPSHGKSNFSEWYVLNLINDYKMKASFFSPEHSPMELHQTNFIQKAVGKNFWKGYGLNSRITEMDIERYVDWADDKLYITAPEKGEFPTWDWILNKFKEQMFSYGIDIFVIDAFNKLELPKGNKLDAINSVMTKLTMFAQMNNVMIFLVVHPTKMRKNDQGYTESPTLYDCSGSADFRNQTHDGFSVYRYFQGGEEEERTVFTNLKTKLSFQGEIGKTVDFNYDLGTGRYYAKGEAVPSFDMTRKEEVQKIMPNVNFDVVDPLDFKESDNDLPF